MAEPDGFRAPVAVLDELRVAEAAGPVGLPEPDYCVAECQADFAAEAAAGWCRADGQAVPAESVEFPRVATAAPAALEDSPADGYFLAGFQDIDEAARAGLQTAGEGRYGCYPGARCDCQEEQADYQELRAGEHSHLAGHSDCYFRGHYLPDLRRGEEHSDYFLDRAGRRCLAAQGDFPDRYSVVPDGSPDDYSAVPGAAQHRGSPDDYSAVPGDRSPRPDSAHRGPRVAAAGPDHEVPDEQFLPEEAQPVGQRPVHRRDCRKPVGESQPPAGS